MLTGWDATDIAIASGCEGNEDAYADALRQCGFLDLMDEGTYKLHDWDEHQGWACGAKSRSEAAKKAAFSRWDKKLNVSKDNEKCGRIADAYAPASEAHQDRNAPSPSPSPSPKLNIPSKVDGAKNIPFKEIIGHLNEVANKDFRWTSKTHQKHISGRWNQGYTLEDFKCVIEHKTRQWIDKKASDGRDMAIYLRPKTLFSEENFENYLNEIPMAE